jgi:hypothetical protein
MRADHHQVRIRFIGQPVWIDEAASPPNRPGLDLKPSFAEALTKARDIGFGALQRLLFRGWSAVISTK